MCQNVLFLFDEVSLRGSVVYVNCRNDGVKGSDIRLNKEMKTIFRFTHSIRINKSLTVLKVIRMILRMGALMIYLHTVSSSNLLTQNQNIICWIRR